MKLIISEKPIAGERIAKILSNNNFESKNNKGFVSFTFKKDNIDYLLIPLKGHINSVDFLEEDKFWSIYRLTALAEKNFKYIPTQRKIVTELKKEYKNLEEIIIATDADREGEAIGVEAYNYLKLKNKNKNLKRAHFSALTDKEVNTAFKKLNKVDFNYADSVFTRQEIDLLWGAILTRYLSVVANRKGRMFLSAGRVQTPLLNLIVKREIERANFKPEKFKVISAIFEKLKIKFEGTYKTPKIFDLKKADEIYNKIKDEKTGVVKDVKKSKKTIKKPAPFNTTNFLRSASNIGIGTKKAMSIAEDLYQKGIISYPRTDNTVYPNSLDFKDILKALEKNSDYKKFVKKIIDKPINPSRGNKQTTDHPPIHPVAYDPKITGQNYKVYDLIARRFLATLYKDAKTENVSAKINIKDETFNVSGQRILDYGWKEIYIYSKLNEVILPELKIDEKINIENINTENKETTPPAQYTEGALIKLMEDNNLGTKSTRPAIIQKLKDREYIKGNKTVEATKLAISVCEVLNKHCDLITKPKLTSDTEKDMEEVASGKKNKNQVVKNTRDILKKIIEILVKEKESIKKELKDGIAQTSYIGKCPKCGGNLVIRHGRTGKQFVGCSNYPKCKNTYPLPQKRTIKKTDKICEVCNNPIIEVSGRKKFEMCLNHKCESKKEILEEIKKNREEREKKKLEKKNSKNKKKS